jgi:hypothetical protein
MLIKYELTGFREETKAGKHGQPCPFCGQSHMVLYPNKAGVVIKCNKTNKTVAKLVKESVGQASSVPIYARNLPVPRNRIVVNYSDGHHETVMRMGLRYKVVGEYSQLVDSWGEAVRMLSDFVSRHGSIRSYFMPEGQDDLNKLPVYPAGKALYKKHGLKAMTNTRAWDRLSSVTNGGSSKLKIKDVGVNMRPKESLNRQVIDKICSL